MSMNEMPVYKPEKDAVKNPEEVISESLNEVLKMDLKRIAPKLNENTFKIVFKVVDDNYDLILAKGLDMDSFLGDLANLAQKESKTVGKMDEITPALEKHISNLLQEAA